MLQPVTILFIILSAIFATTHAVAIEGFFYWRFEWFDILMHFWGGLLIALGLTTLSTFRRFNFKSTYKIVFFTALAMVVTWEVFEWLLDMTSPQTYIVDTSTDMFLGMAGALIGHALLKRFKI